MYPVLVRPIKEMGRRAGSNIHLVVIDYGHLVRQQPFHTMWDHKLPKSCLHVAGCMCMGEAKGRGWLGQQLITPGRGASFLLTPVLGRDVSWWSPV